MTQDINSQLNKLKSEIKNGAEVTLNPSSNLIRNFNNEINFPHKILLNDTQVLKIHKLFANGLSVNIKFSKTQLAKMLQSGGILGELLVALPYTALEAGRQELIKRAPELTKDATRCFVNKRINRLKIFFTLIEGSGVTLTNNEIKDNMKVISL